ncbi:Protein kinase-like domain containing protein [Naviculisporaceae sp. PSN 640]
MEPKLPLFWLTPVNPDAELITDLKSNSHLRALAPNKRYSLHIGLPGYRPKLRGHLATIGTFHGNDIQLPLGVSDYYQFYHCSFFLSDQTGELILRDDSNRDNRDPKLPRQLTEIWLDEPNATSEDIHLQMIQRHGRKESGNGDPWQRVIPRSTREIHITLGYVKPINQRYLEAQRQYSVLEEECARVNQQFAEFIFQWNPDFIECRHPNTHTQPWQLIQIGQALAQEGGPQARPAEDHRAATRDHQEQREAAKRMISRGNLTVPTVVAASVRSESKPRIEFYRYQELGRGALGTVFKVVDYKNGDIWAMKEIKTSPMPKGEYETGLASFHQEGRALRKLKHPHITHLEIHQYSVQEHIDIQSNSIHLFFELYQGNVSDLLAADNFDHDCLGDPLQRYPHWATHFALDILSALEYLHDVLQPRAHLGIKPGNILFNTTDPSNPVYSFPTGLPRRYTFYLADFKTSTPHDHYLRAGGQDMDPDQMQTYAYIPPEIWRHHISDEQQPFNVAEPIKTKSDIWSFGIILGSVLGLWCPNEMRLTNAQWQYKLTTFRIPHPQIYEEEHYMDSYHQVDNQLGRWYGRVRSLLGPPFPFTPREKHVVPVILRHILDENPWKRFTAHQIKEWIIMNGLRGDMNTGPIS